MHGQILELRESHQAEQQAERGNHEPAHQERAAVHTAEVHRRQVGNDERRLAPAGCHLNRRLFRLARGRNAWNRGRETQQQHRDEQTSHNFLHRHVHLTS